MLQAFALSGCMIWSSTVVLKVGFIKILQLKGSLAAQKFESPWSSRILTKNKNYIHPQIT